MKTLSRKNWLVGGITALTTAGLLTPSFAIFDKTRFAGDLGFAFFAFHRYVYNPYKAGAFQTGAPHRTKALVKAGAALLFAVNRVKAADNVAHKSKSPLLHKLVSPLDALQNEYSTLGTKLKGGQFNAADIDTLNTHVSNAGAGAAAAGVTVKDKEEAIPGTEDK